MRANPDIYSGVEAYMQQSDLAMQTAESQLSSGQRVARPSDDPLAFSADLRITSATSVIDTFTANAASVKTQAEMADSALSSVVTAMTQAVSLATEGGSSSLTEAQRASLASQVQQLLATVVSQANTTSNGTPLFAGTASSVTAFVADASSATGYTYQGNGGSNQAQIGQTLSLEMNVPGDEVFTSPSGNVLGSLQSMVTALQSGSAEGIGDAIASAKAAIGHVDTIRAQYGNTLNQIAMESDYLSQETVTLSSQQSSLTSIDLATAATNLSQAQTAQSAVFAVAAKILPTSLLNYLEPQS